MDWISRLNATLLSENGVEIYNWSHDQSLADNVAHRHTHFEICLVGAHGHGVFTVENQQFPIASGDLFIARPGVVHRIQNAGEANMELFWVSFNWKDLGQKSEPQELFRALAHSPIIVACDDGIAANLWRTLGAVAGSEQHIGKNAQLLALQNALLLQIAALGAGENAPDAPLPAPSPHAHARLGARYIHDNLTRKLAVAEIAAHLNLSPRHFQRVFAEFTGVSPSIYLETARIDRARHLLRATNEPIKSIASAVGLPDVHHFTRVFGKCCGSSPAAFRQSKAGDVRIIQKEGALV